MRRAKKNYTSVYVVQCIIALMLALMLFDDYWMMLSFYFMCGALFYIFNQLWIFDKITEMKEINKEIVK